MQIPSKTISKGPLTTTLFYYSHALPYIGLKHKDEISRRLKQVPQALRQRELVPSLEALGQASRDVVWQVFRSYLDSIELCIAEIVHGHSPSFWLHLHRRLRPMLAEIDARKTDDTTVSLVRSIAELAYAKHGDLSRSNDLGPISQTRLETFLDGTWYEATAHALKSKLKAKSYYQRIKWSKQIVMTDFCVSDLCDVYGIEGLCYEYWWATAVMRSIGKRSAIEWDLTHPTSLRYNDTAHPLCFDLYDERNSENRGFRTRLGTWIELAEAEKPGAADYVCVDQIHLAGLIPNPEVTEYPVWDRKTKSFTRGVGAPNFGVTTFSLAKFRDENGFMSEPFKQKHGIELDVVLFAIWAASFFGTYTGFAWRLSNPEERLDRTMTNWGNLLFRGYSMVAFDPARLAQEAIWLARELKHETEFSIDEAGRGIEFISLNKASQKNIGLWSGGKRPVLIPSVGGLMIDLAAIGPFLDTIFFGLKKVPQVGGEAFENSVRTALRSRGFHICLQGELRWPSGNPREVDAGVRIGDRLLLIECFSYELPLDFEIGKPSVFEKRKAFISEKLDQAQTLAERIEKEPKGTNFDVSWAKVIDWRVVSPFVEFTWHLSEPFFDDEGLPRLLQVRELIGYLTEGDVPAKAYVPTLKQLRDIPLTEARD